MDCRAGSRSSRRHSSPAHNVRPGRQNIARPLTRCTLCNIPAANFRRRGGSERPATNRFGGIGDVLGTRLSRRSLYHSAERSESGILNSISQLAFLSSIPPSENQFLRRVSRCKPWMSESERRTRCTQAPNVRGIQVPAPVPLRPGCSRLHGSPDFDPTLLPQWRIVKRVGRATETSTAVA